jgi:hypothetical protein
MLSGADYQNLIGQHIADKFASRGVQVYPDVDFGRTILGKKRRIDLVVYDTTANKMLALECKYQRVSGSAEEKLPYALENIRSLPFPGYLVYSGDGFSESVLHFLESAPNALRCAPPDTQLLDQTLAERFGWCDIILHGHKPFVAVVADRGDGSE